jgi:hypothetical protein
LGQTVSVEKYMEGEYCLGLLLNYCDHSRTVGQFKNNKRGQNVCLNPRWLEYVQGKDESAGTSYVKIRFMESQENLLYISQSERYDLMRMEGTIRWWFGERRSDVQIVP